MSKATFLSQLEKKMERIPQLEKERILNYYNETIEDAMEDGRSEDTLIASFGNIEDIVKQIYAEHETTHVACSTTPHHTSRKTPYLRYIVLFLTSPFWLTCISVLCTLYLCYICIVLIVGCLFLGLLVFFFMGCFNVFGILFENMASGIVLLGCMVLCLSALPWCYWLLLQSIHVAKYLYRKGANVIILCWRKAVA